MKTYGASARSHFFNVVFVFGFLPLTREYHVQIPLHRPLQKQVMGSHAFLGLLGCYIGHYRTFIFTVLTPSTLVFPIYVLIPSVDKISPGML